MAKKINVKGKVGISTQLEDAALMKLTKKELIEIIRGSKPKKVDLSYLDKDSFKAVGEQWKIWQDVCKNAKYSDKSTVSVNWCAGFYNNNRFNTDFTEDFVDFNISVPDGPVYDKNRTKILSKLKELNKVLQTTRNVVTKAAEKAGMNPEDLWNYLEKLYR